MKILRPTVLALSLTLLLASTASAGNIGGLRTSGNIGGLRTSGNIGGTRSAGNIGGTRSAGQVSPPMSSAALNATTSRIDLELSLFAGLIRMLFESSAII